MKQYFTGFFTGVCLVASAVMFMGASESNSKIGRYQGFGDGEGYQYLIDTETAQIWWNKKGWVSMPSTFIED